MLSLQSYSNNRNSWNISRRWKTRKDRMITLPRVRNATLALERNDMDASRIWHNALRSLLPLCFALSEIYPLVYTYICYIIRLYACVYDYTMNMMHEARANVKLAKLPSIFFSHSRTNISHRALVSWRISASSSFMNKDWPDEVITFFFVCAVLAILFSTFRTESSAKFSSDVKCIVSAYEIKMSCRCCHCGEWYIVLQI